MNEKWTYTRDQQGNEFSGRIRREDRLCIARVEMLPCSVPGSEASAQTAFAEEERIGRLISAAPDLLEACKTWVALYPGHKTGDCTPPGCAVCRCRSAIAKAEGR